uniref:Uncharacterized protein n=1 Tax=Leptocylindrus danicus TaxID=163516 RepID=A0A7S2LNE8_9STRA
MQIIAAPYAGPGDGKENDADDNNKTTLQPTRDTKFANSDRKPSATPSLASDGQKPVVFGDNDGTESAPLMEIDFSLLLSTGHRGSGNRVLSNAEVLFQFSDEMLQLVADSTAYCLCRSIDNFDVLENGGDGESNRVNVCDRVSDARSLKKHHGDGDGKGLNKMATLRKKNSEQPRISKHEDHALKKLMRQEEELAHKHHSREDDENEIDNSALADNDVVGDLNETFVGQQQQGQTKQNNKVNRISVKLFGSSITDSVRTIEVTDNDLRWYMMTIRYALAKLGKTESLEDMKANAFDGMDVCIRDGSFLSHLRKNWVVSDISADEQQIEVLGVAEVGSELTTFDDIPVPDNSATDIDNGDSSGSQQQPLTEIHDSAGYDNLDPAPLHGIRVAGIVLFLLTVFAIIVLFGTASRRKQERERESERLKHVAGGLATEEGVDQILGVVATVSD